MRFKIYDDGFHTSTILKLMDFILKSMDFILKMMDFTADALKPWYRLFCKRPCFHDDYLETFNNPNVTLVDTLGEGIQSMTSTGVVALGKEYEVDVVILATGFETGFVIPQYIDTELVQRKTEAQGFEVYGRGGESLGDHWSNGPKTMNSMATKGFPNMFWLNGPQGIITNSATFTLDEVSTHIAAIAGKMKRDGKTLVEVSQSAQDEYGSAVYESSTKARKFFAACTPGYYSNEGVVDTETKSLAANYPGGTPGAGGIPVFLDMLKQQQANDAVFEGFDVA